MIRAFLAGLGYAVASGFILTFALLVATPVDAKGLHPRCNIDFPCQEITLKANKHRHKSVFLPSEEITPKQARRIARADRYRNVEFGGPLAPGETQRSFLNGIQATVLPHPPGCPRRAFCGCGAAVEVFGRPVRSLWLAANWLAFPRAAPAPGMVAARRGHVFVIKQVLGGGKVLAYDANSGGRRTRLHVRSLAGFAVVNPHG